MNMFRIVLVVLICVLSNSCSTVHPSINFGHYYIAGYVYDVENHDIVIANQLIIVNKRDTIYTDSCGHYCLKSYWSLRQGTWGSKLVFSERNPEMISLRLSDSIEFSIYNDGKTYGFLKVENGELPILHFNMGIIYNQKSKNARIVELRYLHGL